MKNNTILRVCNLCKQYNKKPVVNDVSLHVEKGVIFGFLGPNGAGKSTTLKIITGLVGATSGNISVCGYDIKKDYEKAAEQMGAVIENPDVYVNMTGLANLKYYASFYNKKITNNKMLELTKLVGLEKKIKQKVSKYSLGMKQRLGIAQALLNDPKLLILDEPTNGLDVNGVIELRALLKKLSHEHGLAIIVSSHSLPEMQKLCDEYAIINNGKIVERKKITQTGSGCFNNAFFAKTTYPNFAGKLLESKLKLKVKILGKDKIVFDVSSDETVPKVFDLLSKSKINVFEFGQYNSEDLESDFVKVVGSKSDIS